MENAPPICPDLRSYTMSSTWARNSYARRARSPIISSVCLVPYGYTRFTTTGSAYGVDVSCVIVWSLSLFCWTLWRQSVALRGLVRRFARMGQDVAFQADGLEFAGTYRKEDAGSSEGAAVSHNRAGAMIQSHHRHAGQRLARGDTVEFEIRRIADQECRSALRVDLHVVQFQVVGVV